MAQECNDDFKNTYVVGAWLTTIGFAIGLPLTVALVYRKIRHELREEIFRFLTDEYRQSAWYWELLVMIRKLAIALIFGVLSDQGALQLQLYSVVAAIMMGLSLYLRPRHARAANRADQLSFASAIIVATFISLVSAFPDSQGVLIFSTIGVLLAQIVSIVVIIFFSRDAHKHEQNEKLRKNNNNSHLESTLSSHLLSELSTRQGSSSSSSDSDESDDGRRRTLINDLRCENERLLEENEKIANEHQKLRDELEKQKLEFQNKSREWKSKIEELEKIVHQEKSASVENVQN